MVDPGATRDMDVALPTQSPADPRTDSDMGRTGQATSNEAPFWGLPPLPFVVSAAEGAALRDRARRLADHIGAHERLRPIDVAHSLAKSDGALRHRAVVVGDDTRPLLDGLRGLAQADPVPNVVAGVAGPEIGRGPVFVFSGHGCQWPGMAVELLEQSPLFAQQMGACAQALAPHIGFELEDVLRGRAPEVSVDAVEVVQPVLFAVMVSLAALWRSFGVEPAAVIGHSQGEIAAAHVAGALSLEDAARVVALRSRALAEIEGGGGMMAVGLPAAKFEERASAWGGRITVAAVNGPASLVVSGDPEALDELESSLDADG